MERTRDVLLTRPNQVDQKYKINKILIIKKVDDRLVFITGSFIKNISEKKMKLLRTTFLFLTVLRTKKI